MGGSCPYHALAGVSPTPATNLNALPQALAKLLILSAMRFSKVISAFKVIVAVSVEPGEHHFRRYYESGTSGTNKKP